MAVATQQLRPLASTASSHFCKQGSSLQLQVADAIVMFLSIHAPPLLACTTVNGVCDRGDDKFPASATLALLSQAARATVALLSHAMSAATHGVLAGKTARGVMLQLRAVVAHARRAEQAALTEERSDIAIEVVTPSKASTEGVKERSTPTR
ncbi:hypothetical protein GOP47_0011342 [Adiantum capillus-veneris]|uniref:Uncharacterized protein n=1 Tax=Adiantum capillus-veneris TaxID=13818 RepID=A0A9D4ZFB1_ADICA|nr:hypothetical protein GOP47_0011342 [Adiantum capillus-veneris]